MFGFAVKIRFCAKYEDTTLHNVTEIHWNYCQGRVAFESDVHGTGITYDTHDVMDFEALPETDVARAF